jgi:hypothetical protein
MTTTELPDPILSGGFMDELKYYTEERDKLLRFSLVSSGMSLLIAAASRLPTWEVSSSVAWLVGTVNVGFLPIFGPILVFGAFLYALQRRAIVADLRRTLLDDPRFRSTFAQAALENLPLTNPKMGPTRKLLRRGFDLWLVAIPLIAYAILLCSYFDFVRPKPGSRNYRFPSRTGQIVDLLIGTGGWSGFVPLTPAIHDDLVRLAEQQDDAKERARLERIAQQVPWIYPPLQTWAYLGGWILMLWLAWGLRYEGRI